MTLKNLRCGHLDVIENEDPCRRKDQHKSDDQEKVKHIQLARKGRFQNAENVINQVLHGLKLRSFENAPPAGFETSGAN